MGRSRRECYLIHRASEVFPHGLCHSVSPILCEPLQQEQEVHGPLQEWMWMGSMSLEAEK